MQYDIRIKGRTDSLTVPGEVGQKIKQDWENYKTTKRDAVIEISGWTGSLSDIKDFMRSGSNQSESPVSKEVMEEYRKDLHIFRKLTVSEKAKRLGFFRLIYWGFTRENSEGLPVEEKAVQIQEKFFTENPKRMYCDPILFRKLFRGNECHASVLSIAENQVRQDRFAVKYL